MRYPITENIDSFISFFETARSVNIIYDDNENLNIKFENLYNYENSLEKIKLFLNLDGNNHKLKLNKFDPISQLKNTKTWKNIKDHKVLNDIKKIEKSLEKWCYDY